MSENNKKYSSLQEHRIADYLGWKVVSGSGAREFNKGDIEGEYFLGECKTHTTKHHKITFYQTHWKKIVEEATSKFKAPALFVDDGSQSPEHTWVMFKLPTVGTLQSYNLADICPFKTNIIFEHTNMKKQLNELNREKSHYQKYVMRADFNGDDIGILDLQTFSEFFK